MIAEDEWLVVIDRQRVFAEVNGPHGLARTAPITLLMKRSHDWLRRSAIVWSIRDMLRLSHRKALGLIISKIGRSFWLLPTIRCTISPRIPRNWRKAMPWSVATLSASGEAC